MDTIADGDDHVEIVERYFMYLFLTFYRSVFSGMCKICTYHICVKFSFLKNVLDMLEYCCSMALKQLCHLIDGQPHRFVLKVGCDLANNSCYVLL